MIVPYGADLPAFGERRHDGMFAFGDEEKRAAVPQGCSIG